MGIRVGVLGFAHGHVNSYCSQWRQHPELGISVVAGWDHEADRLNQAVANHGLEGYPLAEDLLNEVDAVVIAFLNSHPSTISSQTAFETSSQNRS